MGKTKQYVLDALWWIKSAVNKLHDRVEAYEPKPKRAAYSFVTISKECPWLHTVTPVASTDTSGDPWCSASNKQCLSTNCAIHHFLKHALP